MSKQQQKLWLYRMKIFSMAHCAVTNVERIGHQLATAFEGGHKTLNTVSYLYHECIEIFESCINSAVSSSLLFGDFLFNTSYTMLQFAGLKTK